jgi:hypothetical protein
MELPCAPPLKLDHPYEGSISLEMNDAQNQIIIYRSPLSSTFAFFHAGNLDGAIQVNAILATHLP